jgi:hypothetical protein
MGYAATRAHDERLLDWLRLRAEGLSWAEIGRRYGRGSGQIQNACKAVRDADVALCGPGVLPAYEQGVARGKA